MLGMFLLGVILGLIFEYCADMNMIKNKVEKSKDLDELKRLMNIE